GIGSGSMTAASLGPLVSMFPEQSDIITAYSGASNLLTSVTGLYMSHFIALPLAEKYYSFVMRIKSKGKGADMIEREADRLDIDTGYCRCTDTPRQHDRLWCNATCRHAR